MTESSGKSSPSRSDRIAAGLHPLALIGCYIFIALIPLGISALQPLPASGFWRELSSGLVMVGFAMLLAQFLLSGRLGAPAGRIVSERFKYD